MWLVLSLIFVLAMTSGRGVDLARLPRTLVALLLTLAVSGVWLITVPGSGGCAGGTCIADGYFLLLVLALFTGVLGYLVGGILCSMEQSGALTEAQVRTLIRSIFGIAVVGSVASIIVNWINAGAALSR